MLERVLKNRLSVEKRPSSLDEAIASTVPDGPGQRHNRLFMFCRALKALPQYFDADGADLWNEFNAWFTRAEPFIETKDSMVSWDEFQDGWSRVVFPLRECPMSTIVERARQRSPIRAVARFRHDGITLLANICAELQAHTGKEPFFLSARTAAELLNELPMTAWRYLRNLERAGVVEVAKRGTVGPKGKATRWRYLGDASRAA